MCMHEGTVSVYQRVEPCVCVCVWWSVSSDFPNEMGRVKSVRLFPRHGKVDVKKCTIFHMCMRPLLLVAWHVII